MAQVKHIGELAVVALKARDLPNREIVGKQDPFCVFRLGEEAKKTKTDYRGGQHPVWDDQVNIMVPEGKVKMRVQLFDEDAKREDLISETDLDITTVMKDGEQDGWFPLSYKGRKAGEIYLELTFYAARPPPRRQPTRYRGGMRPQSYQGSYQGGTPPPPVPTSNYPPQTTTGRPLPPAPLASTSTPSRYNVGPAPYIPPQPVQPVQHAATPHMPSTLTPTPSTSAGYPPSNRPPPQQQHYNHPPQQQQHHQPQQQQHHQPQGGASYYPPPASSAATPAPGSAQPLLSAPFRPGHSPQNSASSNHPGYPPQNGAPSNQGYPPQPYPSSAHYGNFSTPVMASYPPPSSTTPGNGMNFPEPQRNSGYPPPPPGSSGFGTPQAYPPYPSAGYPPSGGYPPHNPSGYPPQQQQQQQPHYNPQGYPPHH